MGDLADCKLGGGGGDIGQSLVKGGGADYADSQDSQAIRGDKILCWVVGDVNCVLRVFVQGFEEFLEADRRGFPKLPAELFGVDYAFEIFFDSKGVDFQLLGGEEAIGQ